jgi:predicted Zn-dependent peptidase
MFLEIEPTWALDAVVTVRGPVEAKSIATDLEAAFATAFVPARPAPLPATSKGSVGTSEKRIVVAWSSSPTSDKQETAAHLAFMLACHNRMGRVHRALRHDRTVVVRLNCSLEVSPSASVAWFSAMPSLPYTAADVDKFIDAAVAPLGSDGPTDAELRAARALLRTELARELQTATLRGLPKHRVADRNQALLRHVDDVGRAEVVAAARAMFSKDHRIVVVADD